MAGFGGESGKLKWGNKKAKPNQQDSKQGALASSKSVAGNKVISSVLWVLRLTLGLIILWIAVSIVSTISSCAVQVASIPGKIKEELAEARKARADARRREAVAEQNKAAAKVKQAEKRRRALVEISRWLSEAYVAGSPGQPGWTRLRVPTKKDPVTYSLSFTIAPRVGVHLPPLELALAPEGTRLQTRDRGKLSRVPGQILEVVYQGEKKSTAVNVWLAGEAKSTPWYLLEPRDYSSDLGTFFSPRPPSRQQEESSSVCDITVVYPDTETAELDMMTRLPLERVFRRQDDCEQPVKIVDLPPAEIGGVPVSWDLVVRCYPAWEQVKGVGRWMARDDFEAGYLESHPPKLSIRSSRQQGNVLWQDEKGLLLGDGSYRTSREDMAMTSQLAADKLADSQLFIAMPREIFSGGTDPIPVEGMTVRVVLRLRI